MPRCFVFSTMMAMALMAPVSGLAAEAAPKAPEWYELVAGILAIPATLFGLAYSYVLIKKTSIETRKLSIEVHEKEILLSKDKTLTKQDHERIIGTVIRDSIVASILLRFALMYVVLQLWSLVAGVFGALLTGAYLGLQSFDLIRDFNDIASFLVFGLSQIPQVITWLIIVSLGFPLLREISNYLGVSGLGIFWRKSVAAQSNSPG